MHSFMVFFWSIWIHIPCRNVFAVFGCNYCYYHSTQVNHQSETSAHLANEYISCFCFDMKGISLVAKQQPSIIYYCRNTFRRHRMAYTHFRSWLWKQYEFYNNGFSAGNALGIAIVTRWKHLHAHEVILVLYQWLSARLQHLQDVNNGYYAVWQ